jgi:hypothetical protein
MLCAAPVCAEDAPKASQVLHLAPMLFAPSNNGAHYVVEQGGTGRLCTTQGAGYFVAPLHLDGGATIERVTAFIEDRNRHSFGMLSMVRHTPDTSEVMALTPVSIGTQQIETLSTDHLTAPVVDNARYSYLLQVVLSGPGVCLHGAQVTYRAP